ncbi:MAG: lytic transglycosylase domain-containing protein [Nitrospirae bacterium]|nr:lytic transglycosylase domain-containing protein [Nitrospirota bacterium]
MCNLIYKAGVIIVPLFLCFILLADAHAFCFEDAGKAYGINHALIESIARIESNLNPKAVNKNLNGSIDIGLMQINSFWVKTLGLNADELISNPCYNTMTGARILRQCIDRYGYTWEAVGCYNATSKHKRVNYSWKIFNRLRAEEQKSRGAEERKAAITHNSKLHHEVAIGKVAIGQTQNSELFFSVRDKMFSHELKMESQ